MKTCQTTPHPPPCPKQFPACPVKGVIEIGSMGAKMRKARRPREEKEVSPPERRTGGSGRPGTMGASPARSAACFSNPGGLTTKTIAPEKSVSLALAAGLIGPGRPDPPSSTRYQTQSPPPLELIQQISLAPTYSRVIRKATGGVAEWSIAAVLKTAEPQGSVGSNPTPSATVNQGLTTGKRAKKRKT
jgi:hypothetical protein